MLNIRLSYRAQVDYVTRRAAEIQGALYRMLANIGGPKEGRRRPLASFVTSILLYSEPIWTLSEISEKKISEGRSWGLSKRRYKSY